MLGPGKFGTWGFLHCFYIRDKFPEVHIKEGFKWLYMQDNPTWWPQNIFFCTNKDVSESVGSSRLTACLAHPTTSKGEAMSIFKNVTRIWEPGVVLI